MPFLIIIHYANQNVKVEILKCYYNSFINLFFFGLPNPNIPSAFWV